jgi:hypothetical protein
MKNHRGVYNQYPLKQRKLIAKGIKEESKAFGQELEEVPLDPTKMTLLDRNGKIQDLIKAYRSRRFMAQLYQNGGWLRISVNRSEYLPEADCWKDGISWDDLMEVKAQLGFGDHDAIEIYPRNSDVVNVTNMRHLFLIPEGIEIDCIWRKTP